MKAVYLLHPEARAVIYPPLVASAMEERVAVVGPPLTDRTWRDADRDARSAEVIVSGWGMAPLTEEFLAHFPHLRLVLYGAGSIRYFMTPEGWARPVRITTAAAANTDCVAEFVLAQILLSLKQVWPAMRAFREGTGDGHPAGIAGNTGTTIGLVSLGLVGQAVARLLQGFRHRVIAYDPFVDPQVAVGLGVELVSLDEVFSRAQVVSLHVPLLDSTRQMIRRSHLDRLGPSATLINTARGGVVHEGELAEFLADRSDVSALLDVTDPEPPHPDSPLRRLPNVYRTPHVAGCLGPECAEMGWLMVRELDRYLAGAPLLHEVTESTAAVRA